MLDQMDRMTYLLQGFLEMYVCLITLLDAMILPHHYPDIESSDGSGSWDWDRDIIVKAPARVAGSTDIILHHSCVYFDEKYLNCERGFADKL